MTDAKNTLLLCLICAGLAAWGFFGLVRSAHGSTETPTESALYRVPVHRSDADEAPEDRRKRLREIAVAIDSATSDLDLRAWLIMTAQRESGLARYVTDDGPKCRDGQGGRCDSGRAFGAWQLHRMTRRESYTEQAIEAVRRFKMAANSCRDRVTGPDAYWLGGISRYATGATCDWTEAAERLANMRSIRGRL
jgi:hypothetical protein